MYWLHFLSSKEIHNEILYHKEKIFGFSYAKELMIFVWPAAELRISSLGKNNIIAHPHADFDGSSAIALVLMIMMRSS